MHVPALMNGSVNGPVDGSSTDGLGNNNEDAELQEGMLDPGPWQSLRNRHSRN